MNILMTCHDVQIDRRIISQAESLAVLGHQVLIMALSSDMETFKENHSENIQIFRIGTRDIVVRNLFVLAKIHFKPKMQKAILKAYRGCCLLLSYGLRIFSRKKAEALFFKAWIPFTKPFVAFGQSFQFDLLQCHDFPTLEAAVILAKQKNVSLIYDSHELYPEQSAFSDIKKNIYRNFENQLIKNCDLVFTVNQSIAEKMSEYYQIQKPITLLNALDPPDQNVAYKTNNLLRKQLNIPEHKKILLFQGGFSPNRQLESLVESMRYVLNKNIVLVMLGGGDLKKELQKKALALGLLNNQIYFLDAVSQQDLLMYSASADMGIIPYPHIDLNSYYCTPNKLFEFIQAHLPIIANDSPELRRYIADEGFGIVAEMNSALSIARGIDKGFELLKTATWKENLIQKADKFSWREESKIYLHELAPYLKEKEVETCAV